MALFAFTCSLQPKPQAYGNHKHGLHPNKDHNINSCWCSSSYTTPNNNHNSNSNNKSSNNNDNNYNYNYLKLQLANSMPIGRFQLHNVANICT